MIIIGPMEVDRIKFFLRKFEAFKDSVESRTLHQFRKNKKLTVAMINDLRSKDSYYRRNPKVFKKDYIRISKFISVCLDKELT